MLRNSSNAERESVERECTARIRAAIENEHDSLLRSVAILVAKSRRHLRWPEVREIATEVLHEAVQEALKHADGFNPTRSATAWIRGIAARRLLTRRRAEARDWRCIPAAVLGEEGWAAALRQHSTGPTDAALAGRLDLEQALASISTEERRAIIKRHAAVRNRAAAFGRLVYDLKKASDEVAELKKELSRYRGSEPPTGGTPRSGAAPAGPTNAHEEVFGALRKLAK